jgi:uncharacterized protein (TIGR02145 family)
VNKTKLTLVSAVVVGLQFFACKGGKSEVDFSFVPVKGSNGEYQYIDISQKGKIAINPQFEEAGIFRDGLALVKTGGKDGKWGYIDKTGKYVITPVYKDAQNFSNGVTWVQMENQSPMLIDKSGKTLLQIDSLVYAYPFSDGISLIGVYSEGQEISMFIDKKGKSAVTTDPGVYNYFMREGLYAFQNKETEKWGYKNKNGETVISEQFDIASYFVDGMAIVVSDGKWGVINKKGELVISPQYDMLTPDANGLLLALVDKKYGWINKKGQTVINPQFDAASPFGRNKLAAVQMGSKFAYVNAKGQIAINPQFDMALPFFGDYAMIVSGGKVGFINQKGEYVVLPLYDIKPKGLFEYIFATGQNMFNTHDYYLDKYIKNIMKKVLSGHGREAMAALDYQPIVDFYDYDKLKEKKKTYVERVKTERVEKIRNNLPQFTDSRNGQTYRTVKMGGKVWMADNLNYKTDNSWCYDNDESNCNKYGRLYDWNTAMDACPSGWRLSTRRDWDSLIASSGGNTAGSMLKSVIGWENDGNGSDDYGFSAMPVGIFVQDEGFHHIGKVGIWWTASESGNAVSFYRRMHTGNKFVDENRGNKNFGLSVRCVQEEANTDVAASWPSAALLAKYGLNGMQMPGSAIDVTTNEGSGRLQNVIKFRNESTRNTAAGNIGKWFTDNNWEALGDAMSCITYSKGEMKSYYSSFSQGGDHYIILNAGRDVDCYGRPRSRRTLK